MKSKEEINNFIDMFLELPKQKKYPIKTKFCLMPYSGWFFSRVI